MCSDTCPAYRLVGSETLSDALVAHHYTINTDLDAVIVVDPTIPTFEYQTFYAMGHADEPEGEQGKLHFLEHIIGGVGRHPPGVLAELIGSNGGKYHAVTGLHMTYFTMRFPRDKLALAVETDRDRFYGTMFDKEFVEKESQVVLTELSGKSTRLSRRFSGQFWGLAYGRENFDGVGTEALLKKTGLTWIFTYRPCRVQSNRLARCRHLTCKEARVPSKIWILDRSTRPPHSPSAHRAIGFGIILPPKSPQSKRDMQKEAIRYLFRPLHSI